MKISMKKRVLGGAVAAAALAVTLFGGAPAFAGNSAYCTDVWVCVYKNSNFGIGLGNRTAGFALQDISAANNNEVSSWENRTGTNARWYTDAGGKGVCHSMAKYTELSWMALGQNDNMSSWAGTRAC